MESLLANCRLRAVFVVAGSLILIVGPLTVSSLHGEEPAADWAAILGVQDKGEVRLAATDSAAADPGDDLLDADLGDLDGGGADGDKSELDNLLDMDLDQLSQVQVTEDFTSGALTEVRTEGKQSITPAAITTITKEQIFASGARSLNELLDIYVPNFQWILHHWEQSHIGLRGVISDREDKYLLLVNGRIMNDKTHYGAASERELPQLTDIHHIDVVRGPGSAIYGPGAVSMVIAIYTETAKTFEGTQFTARQGFIDEYSTLEFKHARQWRCAEGGLLLYASIARRDGADQEYSPLVLGTSDPGWPGFGNTTVRYQGHVAGTDVVNPINNYGETFGNDLPLKLHADLTYNDLQIWARYTSSGVQYPLSAPTGLHSPNGFGTFVDQFQHETGNQQASIHSRYETEINEDLKFISTIGFDHSEFARNLFFGVAEAYAEEELNARAILISDLGDHQIAFGGEFYNDWFGLSTDLLNAPPTIGRLGGTGFDPWTTQTYSVLFEDQWKINDEWTTFMGGRWDKNTYTDWMYSPRAAIVYTPDDKTTWKLLLNRSQRMNFAEELRAQWIANQTLSDPEILRSYEIRLERTPKECLFWAVSGFYLDLDAFAWNDVTSSSTLTGNQKQYGFEAEFEHRHRCWTIAGSHSYTQLDKFTLLNPAVTPQITAAPDGFGNDLGAWSDHSTKLWIRRHLSSTWSTDLTMRYYWGFPGQKDLQDRINSDPAAFGRTNDDYTRPFNDSVFVNFGVNYRVDRHTRFRLDGYNLLGLFQNDLNKRLYYGEAAFRSEAPSLALTYETVY